MSDTDDCSADRGSRSGNAARSPGDFGGRHANPQVRTQTLFHVIDQ